MTAADMRIVAGQRRFAFRHRVTADRDGWSEGRGMGGSHRVSCVSECRSCAEQLRLYRGEAGQLPADAAPEQRQVARTPHRPVAAAELERLAPLPLLR